MTLYSDIRTRALDFSDGGYYTLTDDELAALIDGLVYPDTDAATGWSVDIVQAALEYARAIRVRRSDLNPQRAAQYDRRIRTLEMEYSTAPRRLIADAPARGTAALPDGGSTAGGGAASLAQINAAVQAHAAMPNVHHTPPHVGDGGISATWDTLGGFTDLTSVGQSDLDGEYQLPVYDGDDTELKRISFPQSRNAMTESWAQPDSADTIPAGKLPNIPIGKIPEGIARDTEVPDPAASAPGNTPGSPAAGTSTDYARGDHDHGITPGTGGADLSDAAPAAVVTAVGTAGSGGRASRDSHTHQLRGQQAKDALESLAAGQRLRYDRIDGTPAIPAAVEAANANPSSIDEGDTAAIGSSARYARQDHQHGVNLDAAPEPANADPSSIDSGDTAAQGTSDRYARQDHQHAVNLDTGGGGAELSDDIPSSIDTGDAGSAGTDTKASRSDHQHAVNITGGGAVTPATITTLAITTRVIAPPEDEWGSYSDAIGSYAVTDSNPFFLDAMLDPTFSRAPVSGGDRVVLWMRVIRKRSGQADVTLSEDVHYPRYGNFFGNQDRDEYEWPFHGDFLCDNQQAGDTVEFQVRAIRQDPTAVTITFNSGNTTLKIVPQLAGGGGGAGAADGVVDTAALAVSDGDLTLTLGRSVGADVTAEVSLQPESRTTLPSMPWHFGQRWINVSGGSLTYNLGRRYDVDDSEPNIYQITIAQDLHIIAFSAGYGSTPGQQTLRNRAYVITGSPRTRPKTIRYKATIAHSTAGAVIVGDNAYPADFTDYAVAAAATDPPGPHYYRIGTLTYGGVFGEHGNPIVEVIEQDDSSVPPDKIVPAGEVEWNGTDWVGIGLVADWARVDNTDLIPDSKLPHTASQAIHDGPGRALAQGNQSTGLILFDPPWDLDTPGYGRGEVAVEALVRLFNVTSSTAGLDSAGNLEVRKTGFAFASDVEASAVYDGASNLGVAVLSWNIVNAGATARTETWYLARNAANRVGYHVRGSVASISAFTYTEQIPVQRVALIRSDAPSGALSDVVPSPAALGTVGSAGSGALASRADHVHFVIPGAAADYQAAASAAAAGSSPRAARADHVHPLASGAGSPPVTILLPTAGSVTESVQGIWARAPIWTVPAGAAGTYLFIAQLEIVRSVNNTPAVMLLNARRGSADVVVVEKTLAPSWTTNAVKDQLVNYFTVQEGDILQLVGIRTGGGGTIRVVGANALGSSWLTRRAV